MNTDSTRRQKTFNPDWIIPWPLQDIANTNFVWCMGLQKGGWWGGVVYCVVVVQYYCGGVGITGGGTTMNGSFTQALLALCSCEWFVLLSCVLLSSACA